MAVPKCWDTGLEALLSTPTYTRVNVSWGELITDNVGDTKDFFEAITKRIPCGDIHHAQKKLIEDPARTRENRIRRMIIAPLSPHKPIVIPCPAQAVKQRDKQKIEKVLRQRNPMMFIGSISIPETQKDESLIVRHPGIEKRSSVSMFQRRPMFYWGV
jgi:hypothetical protein